MQLLEHVASAAVDRPGGPLNDADLSALFPLSLPVFFVRTLHQPTNHPFHLPPRPAPQFVIGGDVLVVGGTCRMVACTFTLSSLFSNKGGAGCCIAVLGGSLLVSWSFEQSTHALTTGAGPGQAVFVGGGVCILTGFDFRLVVGALLYAGVGEFTTMGGVLVMTG